MLVATYETEFGLRTSTFFESEYDNILEEMQEEINPYVFTTTDLRAAKVEKYFVHRIVYLAEKGIQLLVAY